MININWSNKLQVVANMYPSAPVSWPCCSARILCKAWAASSRAQLTEDVNFLRTSGSVRALPSAVDSLPIPEDKPVFFITTIKREHNDASLITILSMNLQIRFENLQINLVFNDMKY